MKKSLIVVCEKILGLLAKRQRGLTLHEITAEINHDKRTLNDWGFTTEQVKRVLQILNKRGMVERTKINKRLHRGVWVVV